LTKKRDAARSRNREVNLIMQNGVNLDSLANSIIDNQDIHDLLMDVLEDRPVRNHPYKKLVSLDNYLYELIWL